MWSFLASDRVFLPYRFADASMRADADLERLMPLRLST
jgi:hypothetical protein